MAGGSTHIKTFSLRSFVPAGHIWSEANLKPQTEKFRFGVLGFLDKEIEVCLDKIYFFIFLFVILFF